MRYMAATTGITPLKFKRQLREPLAINLTPLIDMVFLLLIFFMVSTSALPN